MSPRLSACITACDEERELARCLESISFVDEIVIVVDAKSGDGTEKLARERADRVEVRAYQGDLEQKSHCASLAGGDWILVIDPDEVVSAPLAEQLQRTVRDRSAPHDGYEVDRVTWHLGRWIRHGDFHPDWTLRLFRRQSYRYRGENPHGRVAVAGTTGRLGGELLHYSYRDLADQMARIEVFSDQAARAMYARNRRVGLSDLLLRPPWRFVRAYLLKRGFLDGMPGLIIAAASAFHVFLKYAKLWELKRAGSGRGGSCASSS